MTRKGRIIGTERDAHFVAVEGEATEAPGEGAPWTPGGREKERALTVLVFQSPL